MEHNRRLDSAQKVTIVIEALKAGRLVVRAQDEARVKELLDLPRGITGLIDISNLSPETLAFARSAAIALAGIEQEAGDRHYESTLTVGDTQRTLFRHYEDLFYALIGTASDSVASVEEIKARMLERVRHSASALALDFNAAAGQLEEFYRENSISTFRSAKSLGGVKVVSGGQRQFGPSALAATRIAGLYCDTQLIPDPVYPFFAGQLHLNALQLQLAINLFHILPLRPLVDAQLAEPAVLIFQSFEEPLEEKDAITQAGIASLLVSVVAPVCDPSIKTAEELFEYARKHERNFLDTITRERLFIPPGGNAENVGSAEESVDVYLRELKGIRDESLLNQMHRLPRGVLVLNGILERLRPQYHLIENASELGAQPLLSQPTHWYYFERCSRAETRVLVNEKILSQESFDILRALQDDSLTWLANIPVSGLAELRQRMEHADVREQLNKVTAHLTEAGPADLESVVKEVRHGLAMLIQRQQKAIGDIENRYSPRNWTTGAKSIFGGLAGASMFFMPSLAAATGVTAPLATALGALAAGGISLAGNAVGLHIEKRKASKTMLGMLAAARSIRG
jgi:hypothetical protein